MEEKEDREVDFPIFFLLIMFLYFIPRSLRALVYFAAFLRCSA